MGSHWYSVQSGWRHLSDHIHLFQDDFIHSFHGKNDSGSFFLIMVVEEVRFLWVKDEAMNWAVFEAVVAVPFFLITLFAVVDFSSFP